MHAENRPEDANPNTWTPAGSDVRHAAEIVNKNMLAGEIPHADHLATVLRAAVAYIDEINRANDAPREIQGRRNSVSARIEHEISPCMPSMWHMTDGLLSYATWAGGEASRSVSPPNGWLGR